MTPQLQAFLDTIAWSEGTTLIKTSDNGYNVLVGGSLFNGGYKDHPRIKVWIKGIGQYSTAAGRYQILARFFDVYRKQLNLPDFGHGSQDAIALQMIRECRAVADIELGKIESAITKCASRWASFPSALYPGQPHRPLDQLIRQFTLNGGILQGAT